MRLKYRYGRQEILGLRWSQIRNGFIYLKKTKTNEPRQIPVNDTLDEMLKRIKRRHGFKSEYVSLYDGQIIEAKSRNVRKPKEGHNAKPIHEMKRAFNASVTRAGIDDFTFHDCWHTFPSQVIIKSVSLKDVQELLGH